MDFPRWHRERNSCQKHDITDITSSNDEKHITDKGLDFSLFTFTRSVAKACADKKNLAKKANTGCAHVMEIMITKRAVERSLSYKPVETSSI